MNLLLLDVALVGVGAAVYSVERDCFVKLEGLVTHADKNKSMKMLHKDELRINSIVDFLDSLRPGVCGVLCEMPGGTQSARAAKTGGLAVGTVLAWARSNRLALEQHTPQASKKASTGDSYAEKNLVYKSVLKRWPSVVLPRGRTKAETAKKIEDSVDAASLVFVGEQACLLPQMRKLLKQNVHSLKESLFRFMESTTTSLSFSKR